MKSARPEEMSLQAAGLSVVLLQPQGGTTEVRLFNTSKGTITGCFENPFRLAREVSPYYGRTSIYITLNRLHPAVQARAWNRLIPYARVTTANEDVVRRQWFGVDVDPVRPRGVPATDQELAAALARCDAVIEYLCEAGGFPPCLRIMSGNGGWGLWRVDLPNTREVSLVCRQALQAADQRFSDSTARVDPAVHAAAQLIKLPTTIAVKGDATADRPHRRVEIQPPIPPHLFGEVQLVTLDHLRWLAAQSHAVRRTHSFPPATHASDLVELFKANDLYLRELPDA
jgi:hypothetical protein